MPALVRRRTDDEGGFAERLQGERWSFPRTREPVNLAQIRADPFGAGGAGRLTFRDPTTAELDQYPALRYTSREGMPEFARWAFAPGHEPVYVKTPESVRGIPQFRDPEQYYQFRTALEALPPEWQSWVNLQVQGTSAEAQKLQETRNAAVATLAGSRTGFQDLLGQVRTDPRRAEVEAFFRSRAQPGYEAISGPQQAEMVRRVAGPAASRASEFLSRAAARGMTRSGSTAAMLGSIQAAAETGALQTRAQISQANEQLRRAAAGDLQDILDRTSGLETEIQSRVSAIDAQIAALQAGADPIDMDFVALGELDFALQAYADEQARYDEAFRVYEATSKPDFLERFIPMLSAFPGSEILQLFGLFAAAAR